MIEAGKALEAIKMLKEFCMDHEDCSNCPLAKEGYNNTCVMSHSLSGIPGLWDLKEYHDKEI